MTERSFCWRKLAGTRVGMLGMLFLASAAWAQAPERVVATDWGRIERLHSAWMQDAVGVNHTAPFVNSQRVDVVSGRVVDECRTVNDGYATDPSDPGHKLHHAILLGAFLNGKQVRLTLQGCSYDRPRIIGVEVRE